MRVAGVRACRQGLQRFFTVGLAVVTVLGGAVGAKAQQLVTDAPVAKLGGVAYVGKYTSASVFSAGPTFHFTEPLTITSVAYDAGPVGVQELTVRNLYGCSLNQIVPAGTVCSIDTAIASRYPGSRYGTLRVKTTTGTYSVAVKWESVGSQITVTPGTLVEAVARGNSVSGTSLATDVVGNIYLAGADAIVRKIDAATGAVSIVAGAVNDTSRDGDGGLATAAHIGTPVDVAVSPAGDVYVVSSARLADDVVRKVNGASGIISTVAGFVTGRVPTSLNGSGNGTDGAVVVDDEGNIYTSVTKNNWLTVSSGDGSNLRYLIGSDLRSSGCNAAGVYAPTTLAVGGGYLYFASAAAIYKISTDSSSCHTPVLVAGTGVAGNSGDGGLATKAAFGFVSGLALDAAGDLYMADATNNTVRMVNAATGGISTIAGAGSALAGVTVAPSWAALALDVRGNVYVLSAAGAVQKIDVHAGSIGFAATNVGSRSSDGAKSVVFTNIGNDTLLNANVYPAAGFALNGASSCGTGNASQLGVGESCVAAVDFTPQSAGSAAGTLSLGGAVVALTGSGVAVDAPMLQISPMNIDFGRTAQGSSSAVKTIFVGNSGASELNLASVVLSDTKNFSLGGTCGLTVAANRSCNLTVAFKPQEAGLISATITLKDNAGTGTQTITLAGEATHPTYEVTVRPGTMTVQQGQSGTAAFMFAPSGGFAGKVSFACSGLPMGATCSFAPATLSADGSNTEQRSELVVTTRGAGNLVTRNEVNGNGLMLASLAGFNGLLLTWLKLRRKGPLSLKLMATLVLFSLGVAGATGCGSGGSPEWFTPKGTTTVSVVTTSASDGSSQTATFVLTVK